MSISVPNVALRAHDDTTNTLGQTPSGSLVRKPIGIYRDLGKTVNDLLTKGFPNNFKFELNTAAERGLKFVFTTETKTRDAKDSLPSGQYIFSSAQVKQELKESGLNFTGTLDNEKLGGELSLADLGAKGFKVTFKGNTFDNHKQDASGELEYKNDRFAGTAALVWKDQKTRFDGSVNVGVLDAVSFGTSFGYFLPVGSSEGGLDNVSFAANYVTGRTHDLTSTLTAKKAPKSSDLKLSAGARYLYNHSLSTTFGVDVNYDLASSFSQGVTTKVAVNHKFDDATGVKARVDNSGNLALALSQKATNNLTFTIGTEVNVTNLDNHKLGLNIAFNP